MRCVRNVFLNYFICTAYRAKEKKHFFRPTAVDIPFTSGFIFDVSLVNVKGTRRKLVTEIPFVNRVKWDINIFFLRLSYTRTSVDEHF